MVLAQLGEDMSVLSLNAPAQNLSEAEGGPGSEHLSPEMTEISSWPDQHKGSSAQPVADE